MTKARHQKIWVAVHVQRGFVSDIRAFREKEPARRQERSWRRQMNPDYDETGIAEVCVRTARTSARSRDSSPPGPASSKVLGRKQSGLLGNKERKTNP